MTALAGLLLAIATGTAYAATTERYPTRPIRLVVPVPPGGSSDGLARVAAQRLSAAATFR